MHSLEGKNNVANIRWNADTGCVTWGKLALPVKLPTRDQDPYGHAALKSETKYCRIVWRMENGRQRGLVQLVQDGTAKKGRHTGIRSKHYLDLQRQIANVERQLAATRKKEHGALANKILGLGNLIQTEALS